MLWAQVIGFHLHARGSGIGGLDLTSISEVPLLMLESRAFSLRCGALLSLPLQGPAGWSLERPSLLCSDPLGHTTS
jgi:hypothetical protein